MLTKDLVRFRKYKDKITPLLLKVEDEALLNTAGQLLEIFKASNGKTRSELLEDSKLIIENSPQEAVITRGLEKLLLDRTEFDTAPNEALIEFRHTLFRETSQILAKVLFADKAAYRAAIAEKFQQEPAALAESIYADLPAYQSVVKFRSLSPERLIHRYNCAQVQGLLIHCSELEIRLGDSPPALLRQFFKYLRFHQLMAAIRKDADNRFIITVDGPLNLFYKTQKYGLNLANFFPAVLHQPQWELSAEIRFKTRRSYTLSLDNSSRLQPYFHHFTAYVPEEISVFQEMFHQKAEGWQIAPASEFIPLEGETYCFPDFTLTHASGYSIAMELFHPWHSTQLVNRLAHLEKAAGSPLIIGVARALEKDPLISETLQGSAYFSRHGFLFREMPTMQKLTPLLRRLLAG